MPVMFWDDQILFEDGQIAMDEACCCPDTPCCPHGMSRELNLAITNSTCPGLLDGDYTLTWNGTRHAGKLDDGAGCVFDIVLECTPKYAGSPLWSWEMHSLDPTFCIHEFLVAVQCSPFSASANGAFIIGACCGCNGETFDWELSE